HNQVRSCRYLRMFSISRIDGTTRGVKVAIVFFGYVLAVLAAVGAGLIYDSRFSPADQQASGGMIAFGELMFGAGVFALLSTVPTALALWLARRHRGLWELFTIGCLAFALGGVVGVLALLTANLETARTPAIALLSVVGVAQMLGSPIWLGGFALLA